ncbi:MAG TPA: CDP-alcohol phosphatidyltransferase family protein [Methylomirabilota bacterium]|nr:CDP-alcohol phosphatidyltransferase family protein [Methylomirabilota bacterium]
MTLNSPSDRRPITARGLSSSQTFARRLAEAGVTPDQISLFGLAAGTGSGLALALTPLVPDAVRLLWLLAAVMVVLRGMANMFDGMVAVEHGKGSALGPIYNEFPDRLSDMALMIGAGYSIGGSPTAGWAAAAMALLVTYVRVLGTRLGAPPDFGGPMAKQHRMFSVAAVCAWLAVTPASWRLGWGPEDAWGLIALVLWIVAAGSVATTVLRLRRLALALKEAAVEGTGP